MNWPKKALATDARLATQRGKFLRCEASCANQATHEREEFDGQISNMLHQLKLCTCIAEKMSM